MFKLKTIALVALVGAAPLVNSQVYADQPFTMTPELHAAVQAFGDCTMDAYINMYGMTDRKLRIRLATEKCLTQLSAVGRASNDIVMNRAEVANEADFMIGRYDNLRPASAATGQ